MNQLTFLAVRYASRQISSFVDESVKPDRPETPAEAKLIGKEFGDFLNLKVRKFGDNVNIKVKKSSGISLPQGKEVPEFSSKGKEFGN